MQTILPSWTREFWAPRLSENGRAAVCLLVTASSFVCVKGEMSPPGATPPGKGEASGGSGGGSAGRGAARGGGNALSVIDFREDMFPAAVTLVFLLLGLLRVSGLRCYCT
uniref:Uncharacterized protein n=1 Tax=Tetraselmis chuii TaxID=63592 RepID=A0A7S1SUE6_9CHLO|mmetsp:Transcript_29570/g.52949  ORF Transcript_29570/g.52949 Transcript_29570/m.52949 type:complete len:110 (+) Transcript_29570:178-507(+)